MKRLIVIGGGAAGLLAAVLASKKGLEVTILEHTGKLAKKILSTGNGKCNMTNLHMTADCYYADDLSFVEEVLKVKPLELINTFRELGLYTYENDGFIYPHSLQAASVRNILVECVYQHNVNVCLNCEVTDVINDNGLYTVKTNDSIFQADYVLLATGGCSLKSSGSDGSGYDIAKKLGHTIVDANPALTALISDFSKKESDTLSGVRAKCNAAISVDSKKIKEESGEIQFTKYGLSGIVIFNLSHIAVLSLNAGKKVDISVNLLPGEDKNIFKSDISFIKNTYPKRRFIEQLAYYINSKLAEYIFLRLNISADIRLKDVSEDLINTVTDTIFSLSFNIINYKDFDFSQVTTGGIRICEIYSDSLMSKLHEGLYFAGEIIDIDGICGGYNLHFAWATAIKAVNHMGV